MRAALEKMVASIDNSQRGANYPEAKVTQEGPHGQYWYALPSYQPYLNDWAKRPEYKNWANRRTPKQRLEKK